MFYVWYGDDIHNRRVIVLSCSARADNNAGNILERKCRGAASRIIHNRSTYVLDAFYCRGISLIYSISLGFETSEKACLNPVCNASIG